MAVAPSSPAPPAPAHTAASVYRPEIDGLRAIAVLAVIANHFSDQPLPSGYLGVDIFFVISGYVITASLWSREVHNLPDFLLGFYERRVKRLLPALILFVAVVSLLTSIVNPNPKAALAIGQKALIGISNISLYRNSTDYFADATELNPFIHTWSLGVEEQFYLFYPILFWLCGCGRRSARSLRLLFFVLCTLSVLSLLSFAYLYAVNQPAAYFLMPSRFWEMAAGCLVFLAMRRGWVGMGWMQNLRAAPLLIGLLAVFLMPLKFAVPATVAAVLLTSAWIWSVTSGSISYRWLTNPALVNVGLLSYSLYLWHWAVLAISRLTIGIHWWTVPGQLLLMFLLAQLSYQWVETPIRRMRIPIGRSITLAIAPASVALTYLFCGSLEAAVTRVIRKESTNKAFFATWWRDADGNYIEKCQPKGPITQAVFDRCLGTSSAAEGPRIFLVGDSHARNYLVAIRKAFPDHTVRYLTMGSGCGYLPPELIGKTVEERTHCSRYVSGVKDFLSRETRAGDLVFVGQSLFGELETRTRPAYFRQIGSLAVQLAQLRVPLVLLDGMAPPRSKPELCSKELWRPNPDPQSCTSSRDDVINRYARFDRMAQKLQADHGNLFYVPLRTGLCIAERCGQETARGTHIWHDHGHITEAASAELAPLLTQSLRRNGFSRFTGLMLDSDRL